MCHWNSTSTNFLMFDTWIAPWYSKNGMNRIFYSTFNSSIWTRPLVGRLYLNWRCMQSPWYIPSWIHPTVRVQDILFNPSICLFSATSNWINKILILSDFVCKYLILGKDLNICQNSVKVKKRKNLTAPASHSIGSPKNCLQIGFLLKTFSFS